MTLKRRKTIFYGLCAVFVAVGALVVFYAQGWRLDFQSFKFNKIGGIYLRSFPDNASIFLVGKHIDKNPGLLNKGRFINGLFPKNYKLTLKSDGYMDWTEYVQVKPSLVSEIKYAVLIPAKSEIAYDGKAVDFWADNNQLIIDSGNSLFYGDKKIKGSKILWQNADSKTALSENISPKAYFINYFSNGQSTSTNIANKMAAYGINPGNIKEIIKVGKSSNDIIFGTGNSIFSLNAGGSKISKIVSASSTISKVAASPSWLAWTTFDFKTGNSKLFFYNRDSGLIESEKEISGKNIKLSFRNENELGALQNDGSFYFASADKENTGKIASDGRDFVFSPKGDSVAILENQALEIFALNADKDYWRFRLPEAEKIGRIEWYGDENHLFVVYPGEIRFLDFNDKALENFPIVASGKQAHYDYQSNTLYFIKGNELRKIVFLK